MTDALDKQWAAKIPRPPLSALIDHIDHVAKVAGIDHVGLGSDFDGIPSSPEGIDSAADLPKITAALMQRGYSPEDCRKILGENFLRFFREVQATAKQLQAQSAHAPSDHESAALQKIASTESHTRVPHSDRPLLAVRVGIARSAIFLPSTNPGAPLPCCWGSGAREKRDRLCIKAQPS